MLIVLIFFVVKLYIYIYRKKKRVLPCRVELLTSSAAVVKPANISLRDRLREQVLM